MHVHPPQQWSVGCFEFSPGLAYELEPKFQIVVDVLLPSSSRFGSDLSSNYFNSFRMTQMALLLAPNCCREVQQQNNKCIYDDEYEIINADDYK